MAVTRKQAEEIIQDVRNLLNRPEEDDFFQYPEEYLVALNKAHKRIYRKIAQTWPEILMQSTTKTSADSGLTYDLGDFHLGQMEVWAPPGPPTGERIPPALPDSAFFGFWVDGTTLKFTVQQDYNPLYIRWVPETVTDIESGATHVLPSFCEDMLEYETAGLLSQKQGFPGSAMKFTALAAREWRGDPIDPSDMGILGTLKRQAASQGYETAAGPTAQPWWRGIS